jgi:glycosyltransferase involved in cell wall biosynthesis
MTDPLGQSQVIPYLVGLRKYGYSITILSCEKEQVFGAGKSGIQALLDQAGVKWMPIKYSKRPPVFSTLWDVVKLKRAAKKIHSSHAVSMVHTRPGIPALVGLWMKRKYGIKFLNDIREFYADSRVEGGMWNAKNSLFKLIYKYFKAQESRQVKQSDGIVCLTNAAKNIIIQWPEYRDGVPLAMIPCSADLNLFNAGNIDKPEQQRLARQFGFREGDLVISYLGSIGGWYLTDEMMRFCKLLTQKVPRVKLLFISQHQHELIKQTAAANGIDSDSIITVKAKRNEVPVLLSLSNYSLFFIKPCYSKLSSSPTKHGEIMGMGIPVITNKGVGDVDEIVRKYNGGFTVNDFTDLSFHNVIDQLGKVNFDKELIRKGAMDFYTLEKAVQSYKSLYEKILGT